MIPFTSQSIPITNNSSLNSMYSSILGALGPNPSHLLPNIYQPNIIEAYYNNLFLQNTERLLLEQLLITQSQSQAYLSDQLWQNVVAQTAAAKSKELTNRDSNHHSKPELDTRKKSTMSFEITPTPLNQNLESSSSAINKLKSTPIKNSQKNSQISTVSPPQGNRVDSKALFEKEAKASGRKKIHKNDYEPRNQIEIRTKQLTLIQSLDSNDCAFDSNDENNLKENEKASLEKVKTSQKKNERLQQEVSKDNSPIRQEQNELIENNEVGKPVMSGEKQKTGSECHYHQLLAHELDDLNSSFSSDDWPSLSGDPDCENPFQE